MRRFVLLLPLLLLALTGCVQKDSVSFGPVEISVTESGAVEVSVGPQFATPMGEFKAGVAITVIDQQQDDHWYVVIRSTRRAVVMDTVYRLDSAAGQGDPDQGWLIVRNATGGKLRMDTSLVWTPEATEDKPDPERPITTTLTK